MITPRRLFLILLACFGAVPCAAAQSPPYRHDLLHLVPDDFGVCIVMHDLRGHAAHWEQSPWFKNFRESAIGKSLLESPEMKQLEHWKSEVKKHLDLDWPTLRDDILGDTLVLSHTQGPNNKPDEERGILLLHVRKPEKLVRFIDKLNAAQTKSGELKSLTAVDYNGTTYYRREQGDKTHFYLVKDALFVFTTKEDSMRTVLERRTAGKTSAWAKRFEKAGAERALVAMCVNPRTLDREIVKSEKKDDPLPSYWRALDAIYLTLSINAEAELRVVIQADADRLPKWARPAFTKTIPSTDLWQRFPERSVFTLAASTDFAATVEALKMLVPETDRPKVSEQWAVVGGILQLDPFKELLPNIGPDWGVCVLPAKDADRLPPMLFAIAVKPGSGKKPVDQELFKAMDFLGKLAVLNKPEAIRLKTLKQGPVEVKYLSSDNLFPPGFQPASALKDGFLLLATSPDAIADFRLRKTVNVGAASKESVLFRISTPELATLLQQRREHVLSGLTERQQMTPKEAKQNLENVIALLRLFDRVTLSQHGDAGQASWIVRFTPK